MEDGIRNIFDWELLGRWWSELHLLYPVFVDYKHYLVLEHVCFMCPLAQFWIQRPRAFTLTLFPLRGGPINTVCFWVQNYFALQNDPREILRKISSEWIKFTVLCHEHDPRSKWDAVRSSAPTEFGTYAQLFFGAHFLLWHWPRMSWFW